MALETLKGITEIGGFEVSHIQEIGKASDFLNHIIINHKHNTIGFRIQNGPIKEFGITGCQVDTLIHAARLIIEKLNEQFPCHENDMAISNLNEALDCLEMRRLSRERRGVEGTSNA